MKNHLSKQQRSEVMKASWVKRKAAGSGTSARKGKATSGTKSPEVMRAIGRANKGKPKSEEHKRKIAASEYKHYNGPHYSSHEGSFKRIQGRIVKELLERTKLDKMPLMELEDIGKILRSCQQSLNSLKQDDMVKPAGEGRAFRVIVPGVPFEKEGEKAVDRSASAEDETIQ